MTGNTVPRWLAGVWVPVVGTLFCFWGLRWRTLQGSRTTRLLNAGFGRSWLAGGGVRGGMTYGASDEYGHRVAENPVHVHDFHATILHLLGLDHTRLTYRHAGRDFRLTDVEGRVVRAIMT